jgi:RES domain-containing protein
MADLVLWRIAKETVDYAAEDMSGGGAKFTGGRWNSKGNAVLYTSSTIALASLELLAHLGANIAVRNYFLLRVHVPEDIARASEAIKRETLRPTWLAEPPGGYTKAIGDAWIRANTSALLNVPSVIVPEEFNVLINPAHPDAARITATIERQYVYDPRL